MHRRLYHSISGRRFFNAILTSVFVGSLGAISYPRSYTIHADDQDTDKDKSDYQVYRDLVRFASSSHRPVQPTGYRPELQHGINFFARPDGGILRYDAAIDYRSPLWSSGDARSQQIGDGPIWTCFAIFQGICGWETCFFVHNYLLDGILADVAQITSRYYPTDDTHAEVGSTSPSEEAIEPLSEAVDDIIRKKFTQMNEYIVDEGLGEVLSSPSRSAAVIPLNRAVSGCTCLIALYESHSALLKIVTTGDSRAVLGRRAQSGRKEPIYEVHELPSPTLNMARHKSSDNHFRDAFGLAMWRWTQDIQERLHREYLCEPPLAGSHEVMKSAAIQPSLRSIEIKPGDFLVMGTDSLWDTFTSKEVVDLVGIWLEHGHKRNLGYQEDIPSSNAASTRQRVPLDEGHHEPPSDYTKSHCADVNAAAHIIKNALYNDRYCLTTGTQNVSRTCDLKQRNGVGVYVIFFDDRNSPVRENLILVSNDDQDSSESL